MTDTHVRVKTQTILQMFSIIRSLIEMLATARPEFDPDLSLALDAVVETEEGVRPHFDELEALDAMLRTEHRDWGRA